MTWQIPRHILVASASGRGKSSLCAYLYGQRSDYAGNILFDSTDIRRFSPRQWDEIHRLSLAYLPQEMRLFPELTVLENIELKNRLTHFKTSRQIMEMLQALDIAREAHRRCCTLSLGQQQRVAAVRALCQPFQWLLLDEPVSHLDTQANEALARLVQTQAQAQGAGVIVTSVGADLNLHYDEVLHL